MLNSGTSMHPAFALYGRLPARGAMQSRIEIHRAATSTATPTWDPLNGHPDPSTQMTQTLIYRGLARVQPDHDWRARVQPADFQYETLHDARIQISFHDNELAEDPANSPIVDIPLESRIRVIERNKLVYDTDLTHDFSKFIYVIRNISESSNSWVRTLLCDFIPNIRTP